MVLIFYFLKGGYLCCSSFNTKVKFVDQDGSW